MSRIQLVGAIPTAVSLQRAEARSFPKRWTDMKLPFTRSKIAVEVLDDEILVTMPGTSFSIVYERTKHNRLIASYFTGRKVQRERNRGELPSLSFTRLDSG